MTSCWPTMGLYRRIYDLQLKAQEEYVLVEQRLAQLKLPHTESAGTAEASTRRPATQEAKR